VVQIIWSHLAINDLKAIKDYISRDSFKFASLQIRKIKDRVQILKANPFSGKENPEARDASIRELIEGNYRIIYQVVSDKEIHILLVHHGSRDLVKHIFG